ncbi:hypothetical protein DP0423 [Desulfotalea psychrophila LSv54]|uniref:Uncharacterized protein n=2 Tax=Desulfotalea psychrophila TaxID=84980 RepID=Q6AR72_DESPS|nr:hypothetical protein DP0423 [Desulfotalea psychrophila LSv54]
MSKGESMNQKTTAPSHAVSPDILNHPERRIRLPEVKTLTGYSTASIYAKMANQSFPKAQKMGGRAVAWRLQDILAFLEGRPFIQQHVEVA